MSTYTMRIDSGAGGEQDVESESIDEALAEAIEWAEGGEWDTSGGTIWVDVSVESEDGDELRETVAIHPAEPDCDGSGHDWQSPHEIVGGIESNPGVWGHGGGVVVHECCVRCGCRRTTDTCATRPDTGEQGLTSISYNEDYYDLSGLTP